MSKSLTLTTYKQALHCAVRKTAKEGWDYLRACGVPENEIFEAASLHVSDKLEPFDGRDWRIPGRQIRALGRNLEKHAGQLEMAMAQYPDLLPAWVDNLVAWEPGGKPSQLCDVHLETRILPTILRAVAAYLQRCTMKKGKAVEPSLKRPRTARGPNIPAAMNLLSLFDRAEAGLYESPLPEVPATFGEKPATKRYAWATELLNLACELAGHAETFDPDSLRKMREERSLRNLLSTS